MYQPPNSSFVTLHEDTWLRLPEKRVGLTCWKALPRADMDSHEETRDAKTSADKPH